MNYITGTSVVSNTGESSNTGGSDFSAVPETDATVDLGTSTKRFRDGNFVNLITDNLTVDTTTTRLIQAPGSPPVVLGALNSNISVSNATLEFVAQSAVNVHTINFNIDATGGLNIVSPASVFSGTITATAIDGLAAPTTVNQATSKGYVDALVAGSDLTYILEEIKHLTKIRFPKTRLTTDETALVFSTPFNGGYPKHMAFDDNYKFNYKTADTTDSRSQGWMSHADFKQNLIIDGSAVNGNYIYIDLNAHPSAVITSFQIYAPNIRFPVEYHLIGSNDASSWTSLYYTASAQKEEIYPHGAQPGAYTYVNRIPNETIYRYVGLQIVLGTDTLWNGAIQELLLWGNE
tara:strand:- start:7878 stop:8921 length:1044 start_codon:yes stop_codon:yes gene_type:complete